MQPGVIGVAKRSRLQDQPDIGERSKNEAAS
jgi:hypothetical protein